MTKRLHLSATALSLAAVCAANPAAVRHLRHAAPKAASPVALEAPRGHHAPHCSKTPANRVAEGDLSLAWGYCYNPQQAYGVGAGLLKQAVRVPAGTLADFAGNTVTGLRVGTPADASTFDNETQEFDNPVRECDVWIATGLEQDPIAKGHGQLGPYGFYWDTIALDSPIPVPVDTEIYMGVTLMLPEGDGVCGLVTDYSYPETADTNLAYTRLTCWDDDWNPVFGQDYAWQSLGDAVGNACIKLVIAGDNLPLNQIGEQSWFMPTVVMPGEAFPVECTFVNLGANCISSLDVTMEIEGQEPQTVHVDNIIVDYDQDWNPVYGCPEYNQYAVAQAEFTSINEGNNLTFEVYISAIDGKPVDLRGEGLSATLLSLSEGFVKNNVCEEGTGTWCGYCVTGIAGMEYMAGEYPDGEGFIGVALHGNDAMSVMGEGEAFGWANDLYPGFPLAFMNRNYGMEVSPSPEDLQFYMWDYGEYPAMATISATLSELDNDARTVRLSTSAEVSLPDDSGAYGIAYTVVEDGVGPYVQSNALSGEDDDWSYGYGSKPANFPCIYNDVARNCSHPLPIESSLPESTRPGEVYDFSTILSLDDVTALNRFRVVAMVVNRLNGSIENACMVKSPVYDYSGVASAASERDCIAYGGKGCLTIRPTGAAAAVYSLDGHCVAAGMRSGKLELVPGVYIVCTNRANTKVTVR